MIEADSPGLMDITQRIHAARAQTDDVVGRARKIEKIISQRRPYAERLEHLGWRLSALREALVALRAQVPGLERDLFYDEFKKLPFDRLLARTDELSEMLAPLEKRLRRETLNVVVVGGARMGKSLLLRRLAGLDSDVIPDRAGDPCTGVRSVVEHHEGAETNGMVHYHSEESLLTIIGYYWDELALQNFGVGEKPRTVAEFLRARLPSPQALFSEVKPQNKMLRERQLAELMKYQKRIPPLVARLGQVQSIQKGQISRFVTQPANEDDADPERYVYLIVREVVIHCDFGHKGVGKVALIDLPGLGEATLGGSERMVETLEREADVALFVSRPTQTDWAERVNHLQVYDTCYGALGKYLPLERWAYLVVNKQVTADLNNVKDCERFMEGSKGLGKGFFGSVICDCSNQEDVSELVLEPILNYMSEQIANLDRVFAQTFAEEVEELRREVDAVLLRCSALHAEDEIVEEDHFMQCFDHTWRKLTESLNRLVDEFDKRSDDVDGRFSQLVHDVIAEFERSTRLPDVADAEKRQMSKNYGVAFFDSLDEVRSALSKHLRQLDTGLDQTLLDVKKRVAQIYMGDGGLSVVMNGGTPLARLEQELPSIYPELRDAVSNLERFEMSARGIIGYKVRRALDQLDPDRNPLPPPEEQNPARMVSDLQAALKDALELLRASLAEDEFRSSNRCAYAVFADFCDAVIYSSRAKDKWATFYRPRRAQVWPEFTKLEEMRQRRGEWLKSVESASETSRGLSIQLPPAPRTDTTTNTKGSG